MANRPDGDRADRAARTGVGFGLSGKLLVLTILFVLLAEVLIFVPSLANFRRSWLADRASAASLVASALDLPSLDAPGEDLMRAELLERLGALELAVMTPQGRRMIEAPQIGPLRVDIDIAFDNETAFGLIREAFRSLFAEGRLLRIHGMPEAGDVQVEIVIREAPLREAMWTYARNIGLLSIAISLITAVLVYVSLNWLFVRPMRRLDAAMARFARAPEEASNIVRPSGRRDELGRAERQLSDMQAEIRAMLGERRRLAELGLAVSKINHDLRNLLASAQLLSDRLASVPDPTVQRLAPRMIHAIDRAVSFCEATLGYGRIGTREPERRLVDLKRLAEDAGEFAGLAGEGGPVLRLSVAPGTMIHADPDQLFRVLLNLLRNARQAMEPTDRPDGGHAVEIAHAREDGTAVITISDTGPGIPEALRARLFEPFHAAGGKGSAGLGLAIAADLVRAHGGAIALAATGPEGTRFEIRLPDPGRAASVTGPTDPLSATLSGQEE